MISQADLQTIATVFDKTPDEISGAFSQEGEVSLGLRLNGRVISQDDEAAFKEKHVKQGKEIGYKEIARGLGIDLASGEKDANLIAEKFKTTLTAQLSEKFKNMTPTEEMEEIKKRADEWEQKYGKLSSTYEEIQTKNKEWEEKYGTLQKDIADKELNNMILSSLPEKMKISREDALVIIKNSLEFERTDSGLIIKQNGKMFTDAIGNPEKIENALKLFVEDRKWVGNTGGMGEGGNHGDGLPKGLSYDDAIKYIQSKNIDPMSPKGSEMFTSITKK